MHHVSQINRATQNQTPRKGSSHAGHPPRNVMGIAIAMAAMATGGFTTSANALEMDFSVDYRAVAFAVQSDSFETGGYSDDNDNGLAQYLRVTTNFRDEETGVELHTRLRLAGDRWSGDSRGTEDNRAFDNTNSGDNVRLDVGFLQFPIGETLLRVGRQETSWNNCFLVCDDRRDRILALHTFGPVSALALYDRRADTDGFLNEDNGDQVALGGVVRPGNWEVGLLYVHWFENHSGSVVLDQNQQGGFRTAYAVQDVNLLSPYAKGSVAGLFDLEVGANWLVNGSVEGPEEGNYFNDDALSEYVRIGKAFGPLQVNLQYVGSQNGGLISSGFDTYSSMINSSPESTNEPTSLYTMGNALGRDDFDENLFIARLGYEVTPKLQLFGAVGSLNIDSPNAGSDTSMVYDLQARYQINKTLRTWVTLGMLEKNDAGRLSGNTVVGATPNLGLFEDDDVIAGSLSVGASF